MLLMKKQFFNAVRSGRKTTTLRYWRRPMFRAGSIQTVPGLGQLRIDHIRPVELESLTDSDARADGFAGVGELRAALSQMYSPDKRAGRTLYQIRFALVKARDNPPV